MLLKMHIQFQSRIHRLWFTWFFIRSSWDGGTGSGPSIIESFAVGTLIGVVSGITGGLSFGGPNFIWHGFIALIEPYGEGKICNIDYKLMFE